MNIVVSVVFALAKALGLFLFAYHGWILVVILLAYVSWQNKRRTRWVEHTEHVILSIEVPKDNDKKELSAEQMFASLHGILRAKSDLIKEGVLQEHISFELAAEENLIRFYVWVPKHLKDFVEGQIYAQYPGIHIKEQDTDYSKSIGEDVVATGMEISLTKSEFLPIKTFDTFEVDPLAGITAVLAKLEEPGEQMWVQVLARPIDDDWRDDGLAYMEEIKTGKGEGFGKLVAKALLEIPIHLINNFFTSLVAPTPPPEKKKEEKSEDKLDSNKKTLISAVQEKCDKLGYRVKLRVVYLGKDQAIARNRLQAIAGAFKQFNSTNLNGFTPGKIAKDDIVQKFQARLFNDEGFILNIRELASLYHLPHTNVETPNMAWITEKTAEPPTNLPTDSLESETVSLFGLTNFRGTHHKFGIKREDRGRHLYIVGQTGTGKSFLLQLLALSDLYHKQGIAIIDPHGDFAADIMRYVPEDRIGDVIYFNPADREFPIAFNPLEVTDPVFKNNISSELVGVLKRMFESWGPRLEHILRFTTLALLDYPNSTMLDITRMLTDKEFRKQVVKMIQDPVVKNFWVNEFASWNDKFANEAVAPVLNKVGAFTANPLIRNVIGQPQSAFNLRNIMDEGKILIVNLSQGLVGEDNASVLGALMVTKIQLAAMSRANVDKGHRRPFYLYVDEFQNFATDTFAVILSEARKYGLYLTVANQYIAQMPETVREAVFGNVGSMISFRISAADASYLAKYFEPAFEQGDIVKLHNRSVVINMSIDGDKAVPFSATTLKMPEPPADPSTQIIELSRQRYSTPKEEVEQAIADTHSFNKPDPTPEEQKTNTPLGLRNPEETRHYNPRNDRNQNDNNRNNRPRHNKPYRPAAQRASNTNTHPSAGHSVAPEGSTNVRG